MMELISPVCCLNLSGAFFIPYLIFLFTCGIPVFFLETALGQYTSQGGVTAWRRICPLFEGEWVETGGPWGPMGTLRSFSDHTCRSQTFPKLCLLTKRFPFLHCIPDSFFMSRSLARSFAPNKNDLQDLMMKMLLAVVRNFLKIYYCPFKSALSHFPEFVKGLKLSW